MNFRLPAILIGLVLAVVVVLLLLSGGEGEKNPDALTSELAAAGVKADKIDAVEFEKADGSVLLITRTDADKNTWQIQKPIAARAEAAKVLPVVNALLRAKPTPYSELSSSPAVHGLEPPGVKVTIRQGSERASTVNLGDVTMGDKGVVFVTTSAQSARPMAVRRSDLDELFRDGGKDGKAADLVKWTADFRTTSVFPVSGQFASEEVSALKLSLPNKKQELALSRAPSGGWKFDAPFPGADADTEGDPGAPPDKITGVGPLLRALANVAVLSPADFIDHPKDLKEYGLNADNPDLIRVEMRAKDGNAVVYLGKLTAGAAPPPPLPGQPPQPPAAATVYARIEGLPGVVKASATNLAGLAALVADPDPLRDRNLLKVSAGKQVDGLDLLPPGVPPDKPIKLRKVGPDWRLYGGAGDPQKADAATVGRLVDALSAKRNIKGFPGASPANFPSITATVYVWTDGFNPPGADPKAEPNKKNEPTKLEFGRRDGDTVYVRRTLPGQPPTEFALAATVGGTDVMQAVTKSRLELLDQTLPSFSDAAVARVTVTGANTYTLEKAEKPDPLTKQPMWRFVEPPPQKGKVADTKQVESLLTLLATSQGSFGRYVDDGTGNPAEFGLAPPRLKVVIGLGDKSDGDRVYEFGKDATDPDKVYARVGGRPAVFTIQRRVFDQLLNPDLRDRLVFRQVDSARATKVELVGWGGGGFLTELTFERNKEGAWAVTKGPPNYAVAPSKVDAFLDTIAKQRVKGFVPGPVQGLHGFSDPKTRLTVTATMPEGLVLLLQVGAETDGGASYFGWTSWAAESPVLLDAAPFRDYKAGPGAFAK